MHIVGFKSTRAAILRKEVAAGRLLAGTVGDAVQMTLNATRPVLGPTVTLVRNCKVPLYSHLDSHHFSAWPRHGAPPLLWRWLGRPTRRTKTVAGTRQGCGRGILSEYNESADLRTERRAPISETCSAFWERVPFSPIFRWRRYSVWQHKPGNLLRYLWTASNCGWPRGTKARSSLIT